MNEPRIKRLSGLMSATERKKAQLSTIERLSAIERLSGIERNERTERFTEQLSDWLASTLSTVIIYPSAATIIANCIKRARRKLWEILKCGGNVRAIK